MVAPSPGRNNHRPRSPSHPRAIRPPRRLARDTVNSPTPPEALFSGALSRVGSFARGRPNWCREGWCAGAARQAGALSWSYRGPESRGKHGVGELRGSGVAWPWGAVLLTLCLAGTGCVPPAEGLGWVGDSALLSRCASVCLSELGRNVKEAGQT